MPAFGPKRIRDLPVVEVRLRRQADLARRQRRVELDKQVELVVQDHLHQDPPQQLATLDVLGDAFGRIVQARDLLPVLEGRPLIVAPELRSRVQRRPINERFLEAAICPVLGAPSTGTARCGIGRFAIPCRRRRRAGRAESDWAALAPALPPSGPSSRPAAIVPVPLTTPGANGVGRTLAAKAG